jgi:LacI family transcriptional regulator
LHALGSTAVHNLLAIINGARPRATEPMVLPTRLVERVSTARRPARRSTGIAIPAAPAGI